jgi:N-acetylglucosaminyldiphosphoundecaprenol N-acetyl-beta-D-mannosaminyltransferase
LQAIKVAKMNVDNFSFITSIDNVNLNQKSLIVTLNAHSYRLMQLDEDFNKSIIGSNYILADGIAMVHFLKTQGMDVPKISGSELFFYQMERMNKAAGKVFFLGSTELILSNIIHHAKLEFPHVQVEVYSPPFKDKFTELDNQKMIKAINDFTPDVLFIGMTAPKQEKWAYEHFHQLNATHICCIGAVFGFYAGIIKRPPKWMINLGLEWFGRLIREPKRMWRRYLISSPVIYLDMIKLKLKSQLRY